MYLVLENENRKIDSDTNKTDKTDENESDNGDWFRSTFRDREQDHDHVISGCGGGLCVGYFLRYSPRGSVAPDRENIESMSEDRSRDKLWRHGPDPLFRRLSAIGEDAFDQTIRMALVRLQFGYWNRIPISQLILTWFLWFPLPFHFYNSSIACWRRDTHTHTHTKTRTPTYGRLVFSHKIRTNAKNRNRICVKIRSIRSGCLRPYGSAFTCQMDRDSRTDCASGASCS